MNINKHLIKSDMFALYSYYFWNNSIFFFLKINQIYTIAINANFLDWAMKVAIIACGFRSVVVSDIHAGTYICESGNRNENVAGDQLHCINCPC